MTGLNFMSSTRVRSAAGTPVAVAADESVRRAADPLLVALAGAAALDWYHTIELAPGLVTPGEYDLRAVVGRLPLEVRDARALDVGTHLRVDRLGALEAASLEHALCHLAGDEVLRACARAWDSSLRGEDTIVRESDGIHLNDKGAEIAADKVMELIDSDFAQ